MLSHLKKLANAISERETEMSDFSQRITNLPPEQQAIRAKCFHPTGARVEFKEEEIEQSIPERFEKIVRLYPDRLAVKTNTDHLTFDQLNNAANRVAKAILQVRGEKPEPVALLFEQGAPAIVAILGILKAGKFYVPLDPSFSLGRSKDILADSTANLIVTNAKSLSTAVILAQGGCQLINIDDLEDNESKENPDVSITPEALAYIVYTSGSTGQPKGVAQSHRYVLYHVFEYGESFHISLEDRVSLVFPWSFNGGAHIIYSTLLNGATLFPFDVKAEGFERLARLLVEEITIYHSTATVLRQLLTIISPDELLQRPRLVRLGGEPVTEADILLYKRRFARDCLMLNSLAATEAGVICRYFFDKESVITNGNVAVGYPAYGKEILLLDDDGNAVGFDQIGEIAVKSRYLCSGYWRRPDLTTAKFLTSPSGGEAQIYLTGDFGRMTPDGCLYHLGRKDFQVKIRGYRVEVAEIETALLQHEDIKEVVVVGREDQQGNTQLVAYFVPVGKHTPSVSQLRKLLNQKLPDYMVPSAFVALDALPLTPNGKIRRQGLPDLDGSRPNLDSPFVAPRNLIEEKLAAVWAEVLSLKEVSVHDHFFDLGGHSLAATRVVSRVIKQFQTEVPLQVLFQSPTIAAMAAVIAEHQTKKLGDNEIEAILAELESLTDEEAKLLLTGGAGETRHRRD